MNKIERIFIGLTLLITSTLTLVDIISDLDEGATLRHVAVEGALAIIAGGGFIYLLMGTFKLKHIIENERKLSEELKQKNKKFKEQSRSYLEGLSSTIDIQLTNWELSKSEKEVAFLLLKGFSLKEVAQVRGTTEKTSRTQSAAIYHKAGLSNRSQLSAFFLEDLLLPNKEN